MVAVIGDIHGCYYTLEKLYGSILKEYGNIRIISIGDAIDRGNFSRQVLDFIIAEGLDFIPGNHEYMMYHHYLMKYSDMAYSWPYNGMQSTKLSYNGSEDSLEPHLMFIKNSPLYLNLDDCFISHAGISERFTEILDANGEIIEEKLDSTIHKFVTTDEGVLWNREHLLNLGKLQIVGHTKQQEVTFVEDTNGLYIDTGACAGNKLSAVIIENNKILEILSEKTDFNDIF